MPHLRSLAFGLLCVCCVSGFAERPNIVFVIADDCTFRDLGCYGGQAHTPHIDSLAKQGMRFTQCFQAAPMCSPTRHNIYTGLYPVKSGAYPNHTRVNPGTKTIVQHLGKLGYRVAQSGKTHVAPAQAFQWEKIGKGNNPDFALAEKFVADCTSKNDPFCLLLCSNEPHTPWNKGDASQYPPNKILLPPNFADTPETREAMSHYLAEVTYFDGQVGETLTMLAKHGLEGNTLLIVVSEQGSSFPFAKWTCYDSGLQSGMIARWPGKIARGSVNQALVEYVDLLPTFIEVAGGIPGKTLQGKSLLDVFAGDQTHKQYVFGEMTTKGINSGSKHFGIRSVRSKQFKYIWNFTPDVEFQCAASVTAVFQSWQGLASTGDAHAKDLVTRYQKRPGIELYDIQQDPYEMVNLAEDPQYDAVKTEMKKELDRWMRECNDNGQQTEVDALNHQTRGKKKPSKTPKKSSDDKR